MFTETPAKNATKSKRPTKHPNISDFLLISVTLGSTEETHSDGKQKYDFSSAMANFSHSVRKTINAEGPTPACNPCLKQGL